MHACARTHTHPHAHTALQLAAEAAEAARETPGYIKTKPLVIAVLIKAEFGK